MRRLLLGLLICFGVLSVAGDLPAQRAPAKRAAVWVRIPITGTIGEDFTADDMRGGLKRAKSARADVVVLELDTPGGRLDHAEEIIDIIIRARGVRFVAVVNRALSAGAAITLACPEVFTTETATIGAATSFMADARGVVALPKDVAEKFQSAWRAVCRKAAQHGRHSALLAEAMVDASFALSMTKSGGKVQLAKGTGGKVLKTKGQILTLTAREAVACGLARAMVSDAGAVGKELGLTGWKESARAKGTSADGKDALGQLYKLFSGKAAELKLNRKATLTQLQESVALKQWAAWLTARKLKGRRVRWQVRLVESVDGSHLELDKVVAMRTDELNQAKRALRRSPGSRRIQQAVRDRQKQLAEAKKQFADMRAWPFVVGGTAIGYPGRVIVFARFGKSAQSYLSKAQRGAIIPLAGQIEETNFGTIGKTPGPRGTQFIDPEFGHSRDGKMYMQIWLRACSIDSSARSPATPAGTQDLSGDEIKAGRLLKMAALYEANNKPDLARATLKSLIARYPKTKAAATAKLQLGEKD